MSKPYVLIVEDDRDTAALFRHVMDLAGYRTEIAANGEIALKRLAKCKPDILFLDLVLPGKSGAELLKIISSDVHLRGMHIVVITGYSQIAEGLPIEPDITLSKPVSPDQLTDFALRVCKIEKDLEAEPLEKNPWDKINGIYNRSFFTNRLNTAFKNYKENGDNPFAVLLVRPESVERKDESALNNDLFILEELAGSIRASVRPTDTVARFGQDAFVLLIEDIPDRGIPIQIADRIQKSLAKKLRSRKSRRQLSASIGVVFCDKDYDDSEEILRDAGKANSMAQAEREGFYKIYERSPG